MPRFINELVSYSEVNHGGNVEISMSGEHRIDSQEARTLVASFREEWFRIGTCTEPADCPRAEAIITRFYSLLGASPPRFVWCGSPRAAQVAIRSMEGGKTRRWDEVRPALRPLRKADVEVTHAPRSVSGLGK